MARRGSRRDGGKERFWRRLLRQWRRSGLTVPRSAPNTKSASHPFILGGGASPNAISE